MATPPAGYAASTAVRTAQASVGVGTTVKIPHAKVDTSSMLPALGETGALVFPLLGIAIVGLSVGTVLLRNRRKNEEAAHE